MRVGQVQQLQKTDPVTQAVMRFEQVGGLSAGDAEHEQGLPRGTLGIQWARGELGRQGVQLGHRSVARQTHPLEVIVQVEMRVRGPCRRNEGQRWLDNALPQPRDPLGESLVGGHQPIPVRLGVEQLDHDPGRTGAVVAIGAPHQRFPRAEVLPSAP